tara:strand:- start:1 stop:129 length:129 start_codon:yes stop_codon:yes gene_type:complete
MATMYVSDRMEELPPHWHDVDNFSYVMEVEAMLLTKKMKKYL